MAWSKSNKYGNRKIEQDGHTFDSKREAKRYTELSLLEKAGEISDLELQKKYILVPTQREDDMIGPRGGRKRGRVIEKECAYYADFAYKDVDGNEIVEDTKGFRTPEYVIKRKLMLYKYGIRIQEI